MSLNKFEQELFDYLDSQPDERRHWHQKVVDATRATGTTIEVSRSLERELWDYLRERSEHVPQLRALNAGGLRRVSMQNLAELLIRLWGPTPKPRPPASPPM